MPAPYAVGVVLWNNRPLLEGLRAGLRALDPLPARVLLWDNGSNDGCARWARENWAEAELITHPENAGFAAAHNALIDRALEDPAIEGYLALNSDALLEKHFLAKAGGALDPAARIGAVQPLVRRLDADMKQTELIDTTGICFDAREGLFLDRDAGRAFATLHRPRGEVFGPSGAVALYHRALLEDIREATGYFDERFFAYYEDVDLAWRARRKGWRARYAPEAVCWHRRYGSMRSSPAQEKLLYRNRLWLHAKNERGWALASPRQAAREAWNLARALTARPYLREVLSERYRLAARMRRDYDPGGKRVDLSEFPND